jgi:hypothetical protein
MQQHPRLGLSGHHYLGTRVGRSATLGSANGDAGSGLEVDA